MKISPEIYQRLTVLNTILLFCALIGLVSLFAVFHVPILRAVDGFLETEKFSSEFIETVQRKLSSTSETAAIPAFHLKIRADRLRRIETHTSLLKKQGFMTNKDKFWTPALFVSGGNKYKVKIRPRGDLPNHWIRNKKSWRIRFKKNNLFNGYRSIDLIVPGDKQVSVEAAAYALARKKKLLVPDSGFAKVKINDVDYGLYLWIEQLSKHTLERQQYAEGEIFSDRNVWLDTFQPPSRHAGGIPYSNLETAPSFFKSRIHKGRIARRIAGRWREFLALMEGKDAEKLERELPSILNIDKFAMWNAISWAFGSIHAQVSDNLRWYYDTTTGLFEPILYDLFIYEPKNWSRDGQSSSSFETEPTSTAVKKMMKVPQVQRRRNRFLWQLLSDFDNAVYGPVAGIYNRLRPHLSRGVDKKYLYRSDEQHNRRLTYLRKVRKTLTQYLRFSRVFTDIALHLDRKTPELSLRFMPDGMSDIILNGIVLTSGTLAPGALADTRIKFGRSVATLEDIASSATTIGKDVVEFKLPGLRLSVDRHDDLGLRRTEWIMTLRFPAESREFWENAPADLTLTASFVNGVTGEPVPAERVRYSGIARVEKRNKPAPKATSLKEIAAETGLELVSEDGYLVVKKGDYRLRKNLIVPRGLGLKLAAGTNLKLGPGVSILVHGPLHVAGSRTDPVRIEPIDATRPWGSIGIISARRRSLVSHLDLRGGSERWINGIFLSGQLSFHDSDVTIENSTFAEAHGDDALNVKHGNIKFNNVRFLKNRADGFDGDWVNGEIRAATVLENGGDGLDFSGSRVFIRNSTFARSGDKSISVGEKSEVVVFATRIMESHIGIAVKDLSKLTVYSGIFYNNRTALALYQKKPAFGAASAEVTGSLFWQNKRDFELDGKSRLSLIGAGLERWKETPRIRTQELRIGDIGRHYGFAENGAVRFTGNSGSKFSDGPKTAPTTILGFTVPDLSRSPVGLAETRSPGK